MDGRSATIVLALALTGTGLAGCLENPDWLSNSSAEVSAFENKGLADEAAADWSADAALVGAMAFELAESPDPRIDADPDPGNGLAPAWWYIYSDADAAEADLAVRAFKVTADGAVTSEEDAEALTMGFDQEATEKLGEWSVDSNAALASAKTDETFAKVAQGYNATIVEGIANYEGVTSWWVSAMSADGFVVAHIDAVTGEVLHVETIDMDFEMPQFEWGAANPELTGEPIHLEGSGSAEYDAEPTEFPFWTDSIPMSGTIMFDTSNIQPGQNLWWAIVDEEGEEVAGGSIGRFLMFGGGEYVADVELEPTSSEFTLVVGSSGWFPMDPVAQAIDYAFMLDLYPPGMEPEEHEG